MLSSKILWNILNPIHISPVLKLKSKIINDISQAEITCIEVVNLNKSGGTYAAIMYVWVFRKQVTGLEVWTLCPWARWCFHRCDTMSYSGKVVIWQRYDPLSKQRRLNDLLKQHTGCFLSTAGAKKSHRITPLFALSGACVASGL